MTEQRQAREIVLRRRWFTVAEVAEMLGFGLTKTKMLVVTGELRSLKDGRSRRILPEWVDEYVPGARQKPSRRSAGGRRERTSPSQR